MKNYSHKTNTKRIRYRTPSRRLALPQFQRPLTYKAGGGRPVGVPARPAALR
ncbi:MAG: hypothetical protein HYV33_04455 [Candidatus Kerfeldbacteria bacterium]|nr:hypothetical protein [Candidatus Kerfeldbacteria bacterium]